MTMPAHSDSDSKDSCCSYKCDTCNRTFWGVYCIQKHVQIHTTQQVYTCSICSKDFISASILKKHKSNKHSANENPPVGKPIAKKDQNVAAIHNKQLVNRPVAKEGQYIAEEYELQEEIQLSVQVKFEYDDAINTVLSNADQNCEVLYSVDEAQQLDKTSDQLEGISDMIIPSSRHERETSNQIKVKAGTERSCKFRLEQRMEPQQSSEKFMESLDNLDIGYQYLGDATSGTEEMNRDDILSENRIDKVKSKRLVNKIQVSKKQYCDVCGLSFSSKNEKWIKEHYLNQHETTCKKLYYCPICGNWFSFSSCLSKHLRLVHKVNGEIQKVRCDVCNKVFADKGNLKEHMLVHFGNVKDAVFTCTTCGEVFHNRSALRRHRPIHFSEKKRKASLSSCYYCEKTFSSGYRRDEHVANVHTGQKEHVCSVCGKSYYLAYDLKRHMIIHTGDYSDKNTCHICNAKFSRTFTLRRHLKSHSEEGSKRFECLVCHKSFSRSWTLQRHTMIHDGNEPFICSVCGERFIFKILLTEHMFDKHCAESNQYKCHVCDRSYNTHRKLNAHLYQHDKQKFKGTAGSGTRWTIRHRNTKCRSRVCETCGLVVKKAHTMEQHRKTHTDQRPHNCPVCDKGFILLATMQTHLKIHTGENFHSCTLCNKYYTRAIDLENHLRGKIHARKVLKKENLRQKLFKKN